MSFILFTRDESIYVQSEEIQFIFLSPKFCKILNSKKKKKEFIPISKFHTPGKARRRKKTQFKYYSNVKGDTPT